MTGQITTEHDTTGYDEAYRPLAGRRLALVESMLHSVFYDSIHEARRFGLHVRLLLKEHEWYASAADWAGHPLTQVDTLEYVDTHSVDDVVRALTDSRGRPLVDGITTFSDYHTEVAAEAAERLGLPGPGLEAIRTANHKPRLRQALEGLSCNVPAVLVTAPGQLDAAAATLGFPLVAKPPAEAISYGVVLVRDRAGLNRAYAQLSRIRHSLRRQPRPGHVLLEQYVDAPEVSVESLTVAGQTRFYGVTTKYLMPPPTFLEAAHSFPATLEPADRARLYRTVSQVLSRIGYRQGPAHTEVKLTADGPRIVEVNPRLPAGNLTAMVRHVYDRNPQLDAMVLAVGGTPAAPDGEQHGGAAVVMLYPPGEPGRPGVLEGIDGLDVAAAQPGVQTVVFARPGDETWHRLDNSGRVGLVYARGPDAATALARARAAGAAVTVRVKTADHAGTR